MGRRKFDITLDDTDFSGLLVDVGLDPTMHVAAGPKFTILRCQAAILSLGELISYLKRSGDDDDTLKNAINEHEAAVGERNTELRKLMGR